MFVLITYDINITSPHGAKRLRNVARACIDYGKRVQNSVFECIVTEAQFIKLKNFYILGKNWNRKVESLGKNIEIDFTGELII